MSTPQRQLPYPTQILAFRKAQVYSGNAPTLEATGEQLDNALRGLKHSVEKVSAELLRNPNAELTANGQQMVRDAATGSSHGENWERSPAAEKIRRGTSAGAVVVREPIEPLDIDALPIVPASKDQQPGEEILVDWFQSRQALRLKIQIAAAAVLLVLASAVLLRDFLSIRARDAAWQRAQAAVQVGDDVVVLNALGEYFEASPTRARANQELQGGATVHAHSRPAGCCREAMGRSTHSAGPAAPV